MQPARIAILLFFILILLKEFLLYFLIKSSYIFTIFKLFIFNIEYYIIIYLFIKVNVKLRAIYNSQDHKCPNYA